MKASLRIGAVLLFLVGCTRTPAPLPPTPEGMVLIPAGAALVGSDDPDTDEERQPRHSVMLPGFFIDRTEVTNAEFARFRPAHTFDLSQAKLPATGITYDEAEAYAKWAGKRLPTEDEWEKAARGTDGRVFPWGNTWDKTKVAPRAPKPTQKLACGKPSRVRIVGSVPAGTSPYGCQDMAGNAWEWVQGYANGNREQRIIKGGAVGYSERGCRTYERGIEGAKAT
ncbi:SUMF1/EgtB/PvdO family nonheme iron enzyme [Armatimonas sp.]|uniref:formylglycine-generating enzyme family protein n=1 Tax=Armatimonas sp. TaxID=1872638 RepID=UPI00286BFD25|nr:SUMF1/EgtB/PvdO family nonheme iron enzyme [Armatimonas sp.]